MLYISIELWPGGDESKKEEIARGMIANDGKGTSEIGNYAFSLHDSVVDKKGYLKGFERSQGPLALLKQCLEGK